MGIDVCILDKHDEQEYEDFLGCREDTLIYSSLKYRELLRRIVNAQDYYLIAKERSEIVGVLPCFLKRNHEYGNVLNSLPFFGSNGGITLSPKAKHPKVIERALLQNFNKLALENEAIASTIITSPLVRDQQGYLEQMGPASDMRIGQLTLLPGKNGDVDSALMSLFHSKTRNMVRKAQKSGVVVRKSYDINDLDFLYVTHKENMEAIQVPYKDSSVFASVAELFDRSNFCIYVAELEERPIAALLVLYFNSTVEYFVPSIVQEFAQHQPNSLLIYEAMRDAVGSTFTYWNWGGTQTKQNGVYRFKERWGTKAMPYYYYTKYYQDISLLKGLKPQQVMNSFRYFYVFPFREQRSTTHA